MTGLHHALVELCGLALWPAQVVPDVTGATVFRSSIVHRVVDGDTLDVWLIRKEDTGVFAAGMRRVRLAHVDTPELRSKDPLERAAAAAARDRVQELARPNPHVGFLVSEPPATDDTLKTYMFDFRDKLMAHNLPWDGPVPVVIEPRGTREPRGGAIKPPGAGDTIKTYPASGDNLQGKRRRRR